MEYLSYLFIFSLSKINNKLSCSSFVVCLMYILFNVKLCSMGDWREGGLQNEKWEVGLQE